MEEFSSKLNGFKKFKTELSDTDLFDLTQKTRGNQIATRGINLKGAGETPIGELNRSFESTIGRNKGMNAGGPGFTPTSTSSLSATLAQKPSAKLGSGYETVDGPLKSVSDNVTNHVYRGIERNTGAGFNNQRSFAKQPDYGQKDLSHVGTMKRQREINKMPIHPNRKSFVGKFFGQEADKREIGRGIITSDLFGKVGDSN